MKKAEQESCYALLPLGVRLHLLKYVYRHTRQAMHEAILAQQRSRASRSKMELLEWQLAAEENGLESRKGNRA